MQHVDDLIHPPTQCGAPGRCPSSQRMSTAADMLGRTRMHYMCSSVSTLQVTWSLTMCENTFFSTSAALSNPHSHRVLLPGSATSLFRSGNLGKKGWLGPTVSRQRIRNTIFTKPLWASRGSRTLQTCQVHGLECGARARAPVLSSPTPFSFTVEPRLEAVLQVGAFEGN
jgi:hypothetical protein